MLPVLHEEETRNSAHCLAYLSIINDVRKAGSVSRERSGEIEVTIFRPVARHFGRAILFIFSLSLSICLSAVALFSSRPGISLVFFPSRARDAVKWVVTTSSLLVPKRRTLPGGQLSLSFGWLCHAIRRETLLLGLTSRVLLEKMG